MTCRLVSGVLSLAGLLAACSSLPPPPPQAAAPAGPRGFIASAPPGDTSFTPLRCVQNGPGYDCTRKP